MAVSRRRPRLWWLLPALMFLSPDQRFSREAARLLTPPILLQSAVLPMAPGTRRQPERRGKRWQQSHPFVILAGKLSMQA
eukprot:gene30397-37674_t